jgi:tetratricopeptide (TPR) repeat protein
METSASLYDGILADSPSPGTLVLILTRMKEEGDLKRVIQECLKALGTYPRDIPIRSLLAETYFKSGQITQAESELNRVTDLIGEFASAYHLQAEVLVRQNRRHEAIASLKIYLAHRPDDKEAGLLLEALQTPDGMVEPGPAEEEAFDYSQPSGDADLPDIATPTLAEIYFQQGQVKEAVDTYEKAISRNPDDQASRERLAELKGLLEKEPAPAGPSKDPEREKKRKIISVLEDWRAGFSRSEAGEV